MIARTHCRRLAPGALLAAAALAACSGADAPWLTAPTPATHARFPISSGAHAVDCNQCHGAFDSFAGFDCLGCHAHDQAPTAAFHAGNAGYAWTSAACYRCHPDGTAAGVDHADKFPIAAGSTHAGISCSSCHPVAGDRKQLACTGCHDHDAASMGAAHTGKVGDYAWATAACLTCHGDGSPSLLAAHAFPIASGRHSVRSANTCLACHPKQSAAKPWMRDFSVADCLQCHADGAQLSPRQTPHRGHGYTTADCLRCHPSGQGGG